jgi:hypothetical protein
MFELAPVSFLLISENCGEVGKRSCIDLANEGDIIDHHEVE